MRKFLALICLSLCMTFGIGSSAFAADATIKHGNDPTGFVIEKKAPVSTAITVTAVPVIQASYDVGIGDWAYASGYSTVIGSETILSPITTGSAIRSVSDNKNQFIRYATFTTIRKPVYSSSRYCKWRSSSFGSRLWHYRKH